MTKILQDLGIRVVRQHFVDVPWVWVDGEAVGCDVCFATAHRAVTPDGDFARAHAKHRAPEGSLRLGDAIGAVAGPVARAFGGAPCTPCEARRRALNALRFR